LIPADDGGYTVVVPALPGCISYGETAAEAIRNVREAIELHLENLAAHR
jgi:predicted RNase H-like HicB family nuclease